jgi:MFS transporter, Spinster family, sphingosine-1-phosphate transporter
VADAFGWRWAFYIVGIPGLIAAYLAWRISEPERGVFDREVDAVTTTEDSGLNEVEAIPSGIGKGFWTSAKKNSSGTHVSGSDRWSSF